jgi:O-6-methylguanine DNA methyltransferase
MSAPADVLDRDLRELGRVRAPEGFADRVLIAAGLRRHGSDWYDELEVAVGAVNVAWNDRGVTALRRAEPDGRGGFELWFAARMGRSLVGMRQMPERMARQVEEALAGRPRRPRLDLTSLTSFEQQVLAKTREIPRGEVRSYGWVAREIGRPRAVRAVGTALGHNPIPLLIPCHRVIRSDGDLGEYGMGGTQAKRAYLEGEGVDAPWLETLALRGTRFLGSRTTHVFCVPTCQHARRIMTANRAYFRDEGQARLAGFRPCSRCRPA